MKMTQKILSLIASIGAIILGMFLSLNTSGPFYILILAGVLYGIYDIYLIVTHKRKMQDQQKTQRKLAEQQAFNNAPTNEIANEMMTSAVAGSSPKFASIVVNWSQEKMGAGALPITVNGVPAGIIKKDNLKVIYQTNVPFNVISMGVYTAEIELLPGDTAEYFVAGNGIRRDRTIVTRSLK